MNGKNVVLVTGGSGSVGLNIIQALIERGDSVVSMSRTKIWKPAFDELSSMVKGGAFFKEEIGSITDEERILEIIETNRVNYVIATAAVTPDIEAERKNPKLVFEVNVLGSMNTMEAARKAGVKRYIQVGSNTTFGTSTAGTVPLVEGEAAFDPNVMYSISKFAVERCATRYRELYPNFEVITCRLGDCWGPFEHKTDVRPCPIMLYQVAQCAVHGQKALMQGDYIHNWTYHPELAREIIAVMYTDYNKLKYPIYNVGSGVKFPVSEFCEVLKKEFPGFDYEVVGYDNANCRTYDRENPLKLAPFPITRLLEDTGYEMNWDKEGAFKHYIEWIKTHLRYMEK